MCNTKMCTDKKTKKVFISYCWTNQEHVEWVYNLAKRLCSNGVDVKFDKWDLREGQDKYAFMESMIQDSEIDKVLIICDHGYKEKADKREGGVGTETQIITPELYEKLNQTKFIPIIAEKGENFNSYMPTFVKSRIGIDLSSLEVFEDGYEQLLRNIYDKPKYSKPKLGVMPSFLEQGSNANYKTHNINLSIKNCMFKNPNQCNYFISDFINEFIQALKEYKIDYEDLVEPYDEIVYNKIQDMLPLRNDYVSFINMLCKAKLFNVDLIIKLFEKMYTFTESQGSGSFRECQFDQYRFFILEIFLYTVVILTKNESFDNLAILLNTPYFIKNRYSNNKNPSTFTSFYFCIESLNIRNNRLKLRKISYTAQTLLDRCAINNISYYDDLINADMFLYYFSLLTDKSSRYGWFPKTYVYKESDKTIDILRRLISKRYFEKIKVLFNVNTPQELKQLINDLIATAPQYPGYTEAWESVPTIESQIEPDSICSMA